MTELCMIGVHPYPCDSSFALILLRQEHTSVVLVGDFLQGFATYALGLNTLTCVCPMGPKAWAIYYDGPCLGRFSVLHAS